MKSKTKTSAKTMTTAEAAVETLLTHGIDTVYALPGLHNDHLFDAFHGAQDRLRVVHTRHEQTSAYMALGAALATGKPQACAVVPGPGFLNASSALLTAHGMNAPVLCLAGQIPQADIDRGHGHLHEIHDQIGLARHVAKYTARIRAPHEAPEIVSQAIRAACSGRQRPAVVECGIDTWGRKGAVALPARPLPIAPIPVDEDAVERAAKILGAAGRPLILVGGGALEASAEVTRLAEMLEAPVVAFRRGQGVLSARHRLHVNFPVAHRLWAGADAVLAIGTRMFWQHSQWGTDEALKIVRLDIDPDEHDRFRRPAAALVGDAADYGKALLKAIPRHNRKRARRDEELASHRAWLAERFTRFEPQIGYLQAMRNTLSEDGIFVDEVTQLGFAARLAFPVYSPRTFLSPGYQDNLGWGLGAALGAKAARPDVPVLAISGDGGFMYQLGDLATAVQHNIAVVVVVFDNGMFGNVRLIQQQSYGNRLIASDLKNPDYAKLAETFGMASFKAKTAAELQKALEKAFALNAPALVHVPCAAMPSPWDMIMMPKVRG